MKNYITKSGYNKLVEEFDRLTKVDQKLASEMLSEARDKGDLSENAEYEAAKEFQQNVVNRIRKVSELIRTSEIISSDKNTNEVCMISTVRIKNHNIDKEQTWTLVSENEVDTKSGRISFKSPIGSALVGKKMGDLVDVEIPSGKLKLEILEIS